MSETAQEKGLVNTLGRKHGPLKCLDRVLIRKKPKTLILPPQL